MLAKRGNRSNLRIVLLKRKPHIKFLYLSVKWCRRSRENLEAFVWKTKHDFSLLSKPMLFRFNRGTLLANIVSLQFTEMSEYQASSSYRAWKSRFFPYIHCKFCRVCSTTKMSSATVKKKKISTLRRLSWYYTNIPSGFISLLPIETCDISLLYTNLKDARFFLGNNNPQLVDQSERALIWLLY